MGAMQNFVPSEKALALGAPPDIVKQIVQQAMTDLVQLKVTTEAQKQQDAKALVLAANNALPIDGK